MEFGPILRALTRNKIGAALIALQIAFTVTVVVNAYFIIDSRLALMERPSGLVEDELLHVSTGGFTDDFNPKAALEADLELLRNFPGVTDAVAMNAIPLSGSGWSSGVQNQPGPEHESIPAAMYMADHHALDTMGLQLIAGRNFNEADVRERDQHMRGWPDKLIITEALANLLWPDDAVEAVLGRPVYIGDEVPLVVIGVVARLQAPWTGWSGVEQAVVVPDKLNWNSVTYLIRTEPGQREALMPEIEEALARANRDRIVGAPESMAMTRERSYALDAGMTKILSVVMVLLIAVTALGILGLVSFSVRTRTKQIGTRRALGATKADIRRYFLIETAVITGIGLVLGAAMAVGFNIWLVQAVGAPKIEIGFLLLGLVGLAVVALLAALGPTQRACAIPPAVATRTV